MATDPRECGWMGCGHPACADKCTAVPLDEWADWSHASKCTCGHYYSDHSDHDDTSCNVRGCGCQG